MFQKHPRAFLLTLTRKSRMRKFICFVVLFILIVAQVTPLQASSISLPEPGKLLTLSKPLNPVLLHGLKFYPNEPFRFDFILTQGSANITQAQLKESGMKQVSYFLAALTFNSNELWVNFSPYEKNKVIHQDLALTNLGRDLLIEDYLLKQLSASLTYPNEKLGSLFWQEVYR